MAGYSGTPLIKKLGIKEGFKIKIVNEPNHYSELLGVLPHSVKRNSTGKDFDFIHLFVKGVAEYEKRLIKLKNEIKKDGMIWVSWPKKSSKVETDMNETIVRDTALAIGLVDVKVCAVNDVWSGLKLVYRLKDRK
jgi:hypothetical protein